MVLVQVFQLVLLLLLVMHRFFISYNLTISVLIIVSGCELVGAPAGATYYSGMADALVKVYQMEGIRGLYRGFIPGMFGVSHGAIQFMTYEEMKTVYNKHRNMPIDAKLVSPCPIIKPHTSLFHKLLESR